MTFILDEARLAVPGEDAVEVTVEQWRQIIRSKTVVVDGRDITAADGPFNIVREERDPDSVERFFPSDPMLPDAVGVEINPPSTVDVANPPRFDEKTADEAFIYASLSSSPALIELQDDVLEQLDMEGAAYDAQEPERFHITLLYIHKIDNNQLQDLIEAITFPAAFTVEGTRIATFPEADDKPVVVMVNPDNALLRTQRELYERALSMGLEISPFSRPSHYKPHVTLAYDLEPPDHKLPRLEKPIRLAVDSIAITRPDYRMARAIRLPEVPGGAAFITRRGVPTAGFFERRERQRQGAISRAIGDIRRLFGQLVSGIVSGPTERHLGPGPHPGTGTEQTVHAGDGGAAVREVQRWGKEHHRPVNMEINPDAESMSELKDEVSEWPIEARWLVEAMLDTSRDPQRIMEDPELYERAKGRYLEEETERLVDEIYDQAGSYQDLPVPPDQMIEMSDSDIENRVREVARARAKDSFDENGFVDWLDDYVIELGGVVSGDDITIGLARDQQTDEIVGAFSMRHTYGRENSEPMAIMEIMEEPDTEEEWRALSEEWEHRSYMWLDYLASKESGVGYGSTLMGEIFRSAHNMDAGLIGNPTSSAIGFYEALGAEVWEGNERRILWSPDDIAELAAQYEDETDAADWDIEYRAEPDSLEPESGAYTIPPHETGPLTDVSVRKWRDKLDLEPLKERDHKPDHEEFVDERPRRLVLPELPPVQSEDIVSLAYAPVTMRWGQFSEGAFDRMRIREEALRERHEGPGDHPGTGTPQQVHAGDGSAGETDGGSETVGESAGGADEDTAEVEPQSSGRFDEILDRVGDAENADPSTAWTETFDEVTEAISEWQRLRDAGEHEAATELRRQLTKKLEFDALAYAQRTEAWRDTSKVEFIGEHRELPDDVESPAHDAVLMMSRVRRNAWTRSVEMAIHRGDLDPNDPSLEERGYFGRGGGDKWVPLEERLYHVTTAASAVREVGLKSRYELAMDRGTGLGGGDDDTVSFTRDPEVARAIERALHEARLVARGDITAGHLIQQAAEGSGAERPFVDDLISFYDRDWEQGDFESGREIPQNVRAILEGVEYKRITMGATEERFKSEYGEEWEVSEESTQWEGGDGETRYTEFRRQASPEESTQRRFELYKRFSAFREHADGHMDPLFFGSNPEALAEIDPDEIRTVSYQPLEGANGLLLGALGEIRTVGTEGLEFEDEFNFFDEGDGEVVERHFGPGTHPGTGTGQEVHAPGGRRRLGRNGDGETAVRLEQSPVKKFNFDEDDQYIRIAEEIHASLSEEDRGIIEEYRQRIKDGETTQSIYKDPETGEYDSERQRLHDEIIQQIMEGTTPSERPTILMTGGYPGAGKSNVFGFLEQRGESFDNYVHVDSDFIKEQLPEYEGWNAALTHQEASDIVDRIVADAASQDMNIIYDATMKTKENAETLVNLFERGGYHSRVIFVDVPIDVAMERAVKRTLDPQRGRFVDINYIATHDHKNISSFETIKPLVDEWEYWDNDVPFGETPILVDSSAQAGEEEE